MLIFNKMMIMRSALF